MLLLNAILDFEEDTFNASASPDVLCISSNVEAKALYS
jgi:hypothetical protein